MGTSAATVPVDEPIASDMKQEARNKPGNMAEAGNHRSAMFTVASMPPMDLALDAKAPAIMNIQSINNKLLSPAPLEKILILSAKGPFVMARAYTEDMRNATVIGTL